MPPAQVWTLKIKPNVKFSDGTPYDAAAVKANWDANNDPAMNSIHRVNMAGVTSEVAGPLELKVTLAKPSLNFDRNVVNGLTYIASPTAFKADPKGFTGKPVGAGPFVLKEWVRGSRQTLVRNPTYWQAGLPKLDQVTFTVISDATQLLNTLGNGQADITVTSNAEADDIAKTKHLEALTTPVYGGQYFLMNTRRAPFDDPRARRALAMALDSPAMMKTLYGDNIKAADSVFKENSPLVDPAVPAQPGLQPGRGAEAVRRTRRRGQAGALHVPHAAEHQRAQDRRVHAEPAEPVQERLDGDRGGGGRRVHHQGPGEPRLPGAELRHVARRPGPGHRQPVPQHVADELLRLHQPGGGRGVGQGPGGGDRGSAPGGVHRAGQDHRAGRAAVRLAGGGHGDRLPVDGDGSDDGERRGHADGPGGVEVVR
ncbi:ABC transporter substrate-binding protein [Yinghuangia aomiensis]